MPKKMSQEERAEYQKAYRAKKKAEALSVEEIDQIIIEESLVEDDIAVSKTVVVLRGEPPVPVEVDISDRARGLPRSNYYSDPSEPGGWTETIQNIDPAVASHILNHPAVKTKR